MIFLQYFDDILTRPLFSFSGTHFTLGGLLGMLAALVVLLVFSRWLRSWILRRLGTHGHLDYGTVEIIASLARYAVLAIGLLLILEQAGIHLSSFTVLAGALGVGVGFGLQNVFSNFVSGLIVMFERPVRLGDHIVVAGAEGDVVEIGMRATTLRTAQGSLVIVPNQSFITGNVTNWDDAGPPITVLQWRMMGAPKDDEALLLRVLDAHPEVLKAPAPGVYLVAADHAGHVMEAHFRIRGNAEQRLRIVSEIHRGVLDELGRLKQALAPNP
ncbi:MAG TPA: mechanosensitive ion channel domain-containing protein [Nevskia sp.]|jgi:small-conductance mechanosensitive channel|nr:mechanosensitive ion channel domain-containing protein [Nevskia sp.]